MALTSHEIIEYLRESSDRLRREYGVTRIGVFGSVARGDASEGSDLDVIVDMEDPSFDRYMDLKFDLEDRFGIPVDVVLRDTLKARLRPVVEREAMYA